MLITKVKCRKGIINPTFHLEKTDAVKPTEVELRDIDVERTRTNDAPPIKRDQWGGTFEFLLSCITMSVGLGNIWRFPYTVYENGGGAFIIPYLVTLLIIGRPLYYLEMALGQFTNKGTVHMFKSLTPAIQGLGCCQILTTAIVSSYYCCLAAISLYYFLSSFAPQLPWSQCNPQWDRQNQRENVTCMSSLEKDERNDSSHILSSSELWYTRDVLKEKTQIDDGLGMPEWRLSSCLLISWLAIFLLCYRGIKNAGKASYFLALFPYVIMFTLFFKAITLEGSADGMLFFIKPQWGKILEAKVWFAAISQCFFSLGIGFGNINVLSSYNDFRYNINRDVWVIAIVDTLTSILAGITIFGILGNLALKLNQNIDSVIKTGGAGIAFITYPDAIAKFESVPWLFAILFFLMLFILAIGSMMAMVTNINTAIKDAFPSINYLKIASLSSTVGFLFGLIYITPGGQFILNLMDFFGGTFLVFIVTVLELVVVSWWYGIENLCWDLEFMLNQKVAAYWKITWGLISPITMILIFFYFVFTTTRLQYGSYDYPDVVLGVGWSIPILVVAIIIFYLIYTPFRYRDEGWKKAINKSFTKSNWGPTDVKVRQEWRHFKVQKEEERSGKGNSWLRNKVHFYLGF